jgi:glycosyltransferase involved in cell wall biosynthesis
VQAPATPAQPVQAPAGSPTSPRIAVVTPYYKEPIGILRQCHESVLAQGVPCDHLLVADGHPRQEIDGWDARHVILPRSHGDNGNTPRGIGSFLAEAEGYTHLAYLDADNWYLPGHLGSLLDLQQSTGVQVSCSFRAFHDLAGQEMPGIEEQDETGHRHVDTSCLLLHRSAFDCFPIWTRMPRQLSPICDRIFYAGLRRRGFRFASSGRRTVAFRTQYRAHYVAAGLPVPPGAKPNLIAVSAYGWLGSAEGRQATQRALGFVP